MKKFFKMFAVCSLFLAVTSCVTTTPGAVTANPVGNKCGVAKTTRLFGVLGGSADCGINKAAKNGGITRISHVDIFQKNFLLFTTVGVRVYGE